MIDKAHEQTALGPDVIAWLDWLELGGTAARTLDQYERDLSRLCNLYPDTPIGKITDGDLLALSRSFPAAGRRVRMAAVRSFFRWAKQTRRITDNPIDYLPTMRRPKPKLVEVFTDDEVERLLALPVIDAAPLAILLDAGLRKAEARNLVLRDCHPENGVVAVRNGKGGRSRLVPMSDRLRALIADLELLEGVNQRDHVFYAAHANAISRTILRSKPIGEGTFARWWRRCLEDADVRYRTPHVARHTFATSWRRRGLGLDDLQILLGHASISTTADVYTHTDVDDVARKMAVIMAAEAV